MCPSGVSSRYYRLVECRMLEEALAFGKDAITISKLSGVGGGVLRMGRCHGVSPHAMRPPLKWNGVVVLRVRQQ